jgi:hypothetical protein
MQPSRLPSQIPSLSYQPSVSTSPSSGPSSIALRSQIEAIYDNLLKTNYEDAYDAALAWFIQSANHPSLKVDPGDADYLLVSKHTLSHKILTIEHILMRQILLYRIASC